MHVAAIVAGVVLIVVTIVVRIREVRGRPKCPVHGSPMKLVGKMGSEEFICRVEGCKECADRYDDGTVKHFSI